ncbi:MAG: TorF family putative porin [Methylococcales bacterium]
MEIPRKVFRPYRLPGAAMVLLLANNATAEIHTTLTAISEYLGKGYSKSSGHFSSLANLDYEHSSGFYVGGSAAYVNFGDSNNADAARVEISPYLGWTFTLPEDWRLDGQWSRYIYDGTIFGSSSDYNEFNLFLHFRDVLSTAVSFSEDYYHRGHAAASYEITGRYPITDFLEFSGSAGYTQAKRILTYDYLYWNTGLTCFYKVVTLDLRYVNALGTSRTSINRESGYAPEPLNPTFFFSISVGF